MFFRLTRLFSGVALVAACGCSVASNPNEPDDGRVERAITVDGQTPCVTPADEDTLEADLLARINQARSDAGMPAVRRASKLDALAGGYACRMIQETFFAHFNPRTGAGPGQRAVNAGYRFYAIGENLAAGQRTVEDAMAGWMASDAHRAIILGSDWTEVGLGVRVGGPYDVYWVLEFGDPVEPTFALAGNR